AGGIAAPAFAPRFGQAVERAGGVGPLLAGEAGGTQFGPGPYSRALRTLAQREAGRTIETPAEQAPIEQAVRAHMANTGKTANDLLGEFATTRAVPPELGQVAAAGGGGTGVIRPTATGEDPFNAGAQNLTEMFKTGRRNIRTTAAIRSQEKGQRIMASEAAYRQAIREGKTPSEAVAAQQSALSGEYAKVEGVGAQLPDDQQQAILDRINTHDFGRGADEADFARNRARVTLLKMSTNKPFQE